MSEKGCIDSLFACRKQEEKYYFQVLLNWEMGKEIIIIQCCILFASSNKESILHLLSNDGD